MNQPGHTYILYRIKKWLRPNVLPTATGFNVVPAQPLPDGAHTLTVIVGDNAGNEASSIVSFTTDTTAPTIANIKPVEGSILSIFRPNISASYSDSISGIDINSVVITLDNDDVTAQSAVSAASVTFAPSIDLADGARVVVFTVKDIAGNISQAQTSFTILTPPQVALSETCTSATEVTATGVAGAFSTKARVEGGSGIVEVDVVDNGFSAVIPLKLNRVNHLFFTSITADGTTSAPTTASVTQDGRAPTMFIDFPADGSEVTTDSVVIAGRVSDLLSGFMGLDVTVNGQPADVIVGIGTNGTFERQNVPIVLGPNIITAIATDKKGNTVSKQITINRVDIPAGAPTITVISGNVQRAMVNSLLPDPITVKINQGDGAPFVNKLVNFKVIRSNGRLTADGIGDGDLELQTRTDSAGLAQVFWTLGSDAGCGNNRIEVLSEDIIGTTFFCASADPNLPKQLNIGSGNNQRAEAAAPATEPLKVWANDSCNGVEGVPITFTVISNDGTVNGASTVTVNTGITGHAEVNFILGQAEGNNIIEADFPGNPGNPAVFNLFGVVRDESQPTTFSGLALNNSNLPIGNAECSLIVGNNSPQTTLTDVEGQFSFNNVTGQGPSKLIINGLVATTLNGQSIAPGSFPALAFEPVIVPNAANSLPTPALLPGLDPVNARTYDGTQDVVLTIDGIEGLEMVVKAGSMTRADSTVPSAADPAIIALNKVHFDKVPMPMPDGAAPPFAWTLQPAGAIFDPPVQITYPNMSGLPAGAIAYFLSFDHDTNRFEIVATGHVTDDGANIISDPGAGIVKAGWGCNCPPYAIVADCEGCAFKCINPGSLQGGSVVVNGTADVNDDIVCEGKTITFTASGVTHVDGELQVNCPDVGIIIDPIIGDPTYEWIITSPALSAPLTGVGSTAEVTNALAGVYTCVFTAMVVDPPGATVSCAPADLPLVAIDATAVRVEIIRFKNSKMGTAYKDIDENYKYMGVYSGEIVKFGVKTEPADIILPNGFLNWTRSVAADTPEVDVTFGSAGTHVLSEDSCDVKSVEVQAVDVPTGIGETVYAALFPVYTGIALAHDLIGTDITTLEPFIWANSAYPGTQHNTIADAARHSYWNCLLTRYTTAGYAAGLTFQHEVSSPGPSTETVMDLHNNAIGISLESEHSHISDNTCCQAAVQQAVTNGILVYLDSSYGSTNTNEDALLQPTNR